MPFSSLAPALTPFRDTKPTLLVSWWCTFYSIAIITIRVCGRYVRAEKVFTEDGIMMLACTPLLIRMGFIHVVLLYGTNNVETGTLQVGSEEVRRREMGSQMVLAGRVFYVGYLWGIKYSTTLFLRTLTRTVWQKSHQRALRYLHIFLLVTFIATVVADLGACQPFSKYYQVLPPPPQQCRQGSAHLLTTATLDIVTNIALIIFPIPMVLKSRVSKKQKLTIILRLSLPLLSIALTLTSLPHLISSHFAQPLRTLYASFSILLATFTSNTIVLFSLLSDRGYKASKPRKGDNTGWMGKGRRQSLWGSDEDLIVGEGAVGLRDLSKKGGKGKEGEVEGVKEPGKVKMQEIRVNSTWEISVDGK